MGIDAVAIQNELCAREAEVFDLVREIERLCNTGGPVRSSPRYDDIKALATSIGYERIMPSSLDTLRAEAVKWASKLDKPAPWPLRSEMRFTVDVDGITNDDGFSRIVGATDAEDALIKARWSPDNLELDDAKEYVCSVSHGEQVVLESGWNAPEAGELAWEVWCCMRHQTWHDSLANIDSAKIWNSFPEANRKAWREVESSLPRSPIGANPKDVGEYAYMKFRAAVGMADKNRWEDLESPERAAWAAVETKLGKSHDLKRDNHVVNAGVEHQRGVSR